jgi:hypothetical protein
MSLRLRLLGCALAALALAGPAGAIQPLGGEIRVSQMGPDGNAMFNAQDPAVAYNPARDEYLTVWFGDDTTPGETEIWGRLLRGDGTPIGGEFRLSDMGADGNANFQALHPAVAFNPAANEYLVVWRADDTTDNEDEIYGQRVSALGDEVGTNDFRISDMGPDGNIAFDADDPAVAFNAATNEYLVVWSGTDNTPPLTANDTEIFGQRLTAAGAEVGTNDFRISDMSPDDMTIYRANRPDVTVNGGAGEYLVVWMGVEAPLVNNETEIFGQRLTAAGAEVGTNDFRFSDMGPEGTATYRASDPAAVFNPAANAYLVVWYGNDDTPPLAPGEDEIYGQRLSADGSEIGANDFRISDMGPDGNAAFYACCSAVAYNATANEYFVTWNGDDDTPPLVDNEYEVFAQRLDGAGSQVGGNDVRISQAGPDGNAQYSAGSPAVAWGQARNEYLLVWDGDDDLPGLVVNEGEVFARRAGAVPAPPPAPPPGTPGLDQTDPVLTLVGALRQRAVANRRLNVQVRCDEPCTVTVRARIVFPGRLPAAAQARIALPKVTRQLAAGKRVKIGVPLGKKGRRTVRAALTARKAVTANITVTARDAAGNATVARRTVRIVG